MRMRTARYAGWEKPEAKAMLAKGATLESIAARVAKEKIEPKPKSGRQEYLREPAEPLSVRGHLSSEENHG